MTTDKPTTTQAEAAPPVGTYKCPVCGWDKGPHEHTMADVINRLEHAHRAWGEEMMMRIALESRLDDALARAEAAPPRATTPRNPSCTIPGCDCQNGPPIDRCAECAAALPHHRDTCSRYTSNRGYGVLVRSPLAGSPPTPPEPSPESGALVEALHDAVARCALSGGKEEGWVEVRACRAALFNRLAALERTRVAALAVLTCYESGFVAAELALDRSVTALRAALSPSGEPTTESES